MDAKIKKFFLFGMQMPKAVCKTKKTGVLFKAPKPETKTSCLRP
jgi:hypothetical protein